MPQPRGDAITNNSSKRQKSLTCTATEDKSRVKKDL
jgi:hypothetical protein